MWRCWGATLDSLDQTIVDELSQSLVDDGLGQAGDVHDPVAPRCARFHSVQDRLSLPGLPTGPDGPLLTAAAAAHAGLTRGYGASAGDQHIGVVAVGAGASGHTVIVAVETTKGYRRTGPAG
jgi:hypothetical protein